MENSRPQDEVRAMPIVMVGIVSSVVIIALVFAVITWFEIQKNRGYVAREGMPIMPPEISTVMDRQQMDLITYGWVDEEKGVVRLPIDRAMQIVAGEE